MPCIVVNVKDEYDVYCGRPSKWGNPFSHKEGTLAKFKTNSKKESIDKFREYLLNNKELLNSLPELKDKRISCFCHPKSCHLDIIADMVNDLDRKSIF